MTRRGLRAGIGTVVALSLLTAAGARGQQPPRTAMDVADSDGTRDDRAGWFDPAFELFVVPYGGFPMLSTLGAGQALGAHLVWPPDATLGLSARYALRWDRQDGRYDAGSLDGLWRFMEYEGATLSLTGGWARWDGQDHATGGARLTFPFTPPIEDDHAILQAWLDVRWAQPLRDGLEGVVWTEIMLALVLPVQFL